MLSGFIYATLAMAFTFPIKKSRRARNEIADIGFEEQAKQASTTFEKLANLSTSLHRLYSNSSVSRREVLPLRFRYFYIELGEEWYV